MKVRISDPIIEVVMKVNGIIETYLSAAGVAFPKQYCTFYFQFLKPYREWVPVSQNFSRVPSVALTTPNRSLELLSMMTKMKKSKSS